MNGWSTAVTSYIITIIISLLVAGLIQIMVAVLSRFTKSASAAARGLIEDQPAQEINDDAAIAAVIAIAKNLQTVSEGTKR